jgi:hypothetical protein
MALRISEVAACCSSVSAACFCASASSRVSRARSVSLEEFLGRAAFGVSLRFGIVGLRFCVFAGFRLTVPRRLTSPPAGQTTSAYHIMRVVVQHSKIARSTSAVGQLHALPHRSIAVRFTPVSGIDSRSQGLPSRAMSGPSAPQQKPRYSIVSSAVASSVAGTSRPSAFAVLRLITSSYLVGCWTGSSATFAPLRIRSA